MDERERAGMSYGARADDVTRDGAVMARSEGTGIHSRRPLKRPLHQHRIHPAVEFEAHLLQRAHHAEAERAVQPDGRVVLAVADHRHHLLPGPSSAPLDEGRKQRTPDAPAAIAVAYVHRVLHREAVRGARAVGPSVGIAEDLPLLLVYKVRQPSLAHGLEARAYLRLVRWHLLERSEPM